MAHGYNADLVRNYGPRFTYWWSAGPHVRILPMACILHFGGCARYLWWVILKTVRNRPDTAWNRPEHIILFQSLLPLL